jgi:hypothetical protein
MKTLQLHEYRGRLTSAIDGPGKDPPKKLRARSRGGGRRPPSPPARRRGHSSAPSRLRFLGRRPCTPMYAPSRTERERPTVLATPGREGELPRIPRRMPCRSQSRMGSPSICSRVLASVPCRRDRSQSFLYALLFGGRDPLHARHPGSGTSSSASCSGDSPPIPYSVRA